MLTPTPRASRFTMRLPMRYRPAGSPDWCTGATIDISASGLLFTTGTVLTPGTAIELSIDLSEGRRDGAGRLVCQASVIRSAAMGDSNGALVAASIAEYTLVPRSREGESPL